MEQKTSEFLRGLKDEDPFNDSMTYRPTLGIMLGDSALSPVPVLKLEHTWGDTHVALTSFVYDPDGGEDPDVYELTSYVDLKALLAFAEQLQKSFGPRYNRLAEA